MTTKVCITCKCTKPFSDFNKHKRYADGLQQKCRECSKQYYKDNKQRILQVQQVWVETNREKSTSYKRSWKHRNKDYVKGYNESHRKSNLPLYAYYESQRNKKVKQATPTWLSEDQIGQIKDLYQHANDCFVVSGQKYHVDHIVPINNKNVCGLNVPWNLQILPSDINEKKSNKFDGWQERTPDPR